LHHPEKQSKNMPNKKSIEQIFEQTNTSDIAFDLRHYLSVRRFSNTPPPTQAELVCYGLVRMGGEIASDGFICLFHEVYGPEYFSKICNALTEVGGTKLRDLLREAWSIYTKGKDPITVSELRAISVRRFNTRELMDRFDAIGDEVEKEIHDQHATGKFWSVEYAKLHRHEFEPIQP
jgi:Domain of unknown function (DUF4375)